MRACAANKQYSYSNKEPNQSLENQCLYKRNNNEQEQTTKSRKTKTKIRKKAGNQWRNTAIKQRHTETSCMLGPIA